MKFDKEFLVRLTESYTKEHSKHVISDTLSCHDRWSVGHTMVFTWENKFYSVQYSVGATEMQEERPFQYEEKEIECQEVFPEQITMTVFKPKK